MLFIIAALALVTGVAAEQKPDTCPGASAELDYSTGMALAQLQRWPEARACFEAGQAKDPRDKRFPLELAGISFRLRETQKAKDWLLRALRLDSGDAYGNEFLAGLYFLDGNLDAALKYWNRVSKPVIGEVRTVPVPRVQPVLFDRCLAFSPSSILTRKQWLATQSALNFLGIYTMFRMDLAPKPDGDFDLQLRTQERRGWGDSKPEHVMSVLREAPFGTLHFDLFDLRGSASNLQTMVRLDPRKRRLLGSFSIPLRSNPKRRLHFWVDGRDESWDTSRSYRGNDPAALFRLESIAAGAEMESLLSDRWVWRTGGTISGRRFSTVPQPLMDSGLFQNGVLLKYESGLAGPLWTIPERRLQLSSIVNWQIGKSLFQSSRPFTKFEGGVEWQWLPRPTGDDYRVAGSFKAAKAFGSVPFDELFSLGQERDNDLFLRAHSGTVRQRKGAGPLGRDYVLWNNEMDKAVYRGVWWNLKAGPFLDAGRAFDSSGTFGSGRWLWDAGLQVKFSVLRSREVVLSYGRELRSNGRAFYVRVF